MKFFIIVSLVIGLLPPLARAQNFEVIAVSNEYRQTCATLVKNNLFTNREKSALNNEVTILLNRILQSNSKIDTLFIAMLRDNLVALDRISISTLPADTLILREVIRDLELKNNSLEAGGLIEAFKFVFPVEIITRRFDQGDFKPVKGYNVYANPWVRQNKMPARVKFPNSTNPGSISGLPPGRYFIWVESIASPNTVFPKKVEPTTVEYKPEASSQQFFIDIID